MRICKNKYTNQRAYVMLFNTYTRIFVMVKIQKC